MKNRSANKRIDAGLEEIIEEIRKNISNSLNINISFTKASEHLAKRIKEQKIKKIFGEEPIITF